MRIKKRKGKDLNIIWKVSFKTGGIITESYRDRLKLICYDQFGFACTLPIGTIDSEGIHTKFEGERQKALGLYRITLWIDVDSDNNTSCVDLPDAFELVRYTTEENGDGSVLDLDGDIVVTAVDLEYGKNDLSAIVTLVNDLKRKFNDFVTTTDNLIDIL